MAYGDSQYYYASVPLPEQHHTLPYNDTPFAQKPTGPSTLVIAQERASRRRVARNTCLISTGILILLTGMIFAFLSFICIFHQCQASRLAIVSTAPLGRVLTISQVTSHVVPFSVPIIMGLFSYLLSAQWLKSSADSGPNRPSAAQLGLLMLMCSGAGLSSLFSSAKYIVKRPEDGQKVATPPILHQSTVFLGSLLAVTYLTAAADSWLHASGTSVSITSNVPYTLPVVPNFGREINATTCQLAGKTPDGGPDPKSAATCGLINSGAHGATAELGEGSRLVHNASTIHQILLTDDQTAIVVPLSLPQNITYSARTLGVKSQCSTITKQCLQPTINSFGGSLYYGSDAALNLNCSQAGIKYLNNNNTNAGVCALDDQGICTFGLNIPSNPFTTGEVTTSMSYIDPDSTYDAFVNNTGWFLHGESGGWNVIYCNVTVLDVTYLYQSSRYITQSASPKSLEDARTIISAPLGDVTLGAVSLAVEGSGLDSDPTYEQAYSWELSRQMIGRAAYIYGSANVLQIQSQIDVNGSRLQLIPMMLFIGALIVFGLQILYITLRVIIATWGVEYVALAAEHITDPLTTLQRLYGHPDPALTWEADTSKRFGSETAGDCLRIGPVQLSHDVGQGSVFVVTKG